LGGARRDITHLASELFRSEETKGSEKPRAIEKDGFTVPKPRKQKRTKDSKWGYGHRSLEKEQKPKEGGHKQIQMCIQQNSGGNNPVHWKREVKITNQVFGSSKPRRRARKPRKKAQSQT